MAVKPLLTNTYTVLMAAAPPGSDTVIANVCDEPAPEEGVTETVGGTGVALITVLSLMLLLADPPPETDTEFDSGVPAFDATFTVTVIG